MRPRFKVTEIDNGWDALRKAAKDLKDGKDYVKVGVLGDGEARTEGEVSNVDLALIHEYGAGHVPERSFIRSSFEAHRADYLALLRRMTALVYAQKLTVHKMLGLLGVKMATDMKNRVTEGSGIPPPLAEATIKAKGSSRPLVDTGQLVNSITWKIAKNGER